MRSPTPKGHDGLTTLQINALAQFLGTRNFTAHDIARYSYEQIARLPKIGSKGMVRIEEWLSHHGFQLPKPEDEKQNARPPREQTRLSQAVKLLRKNGYDVHLRTSSDKSS